MTPASSQQRDLLALILKRNPEFGTAGSVLAKDPRPERARPRPGSRGRHETPLHCGFARDQSVQQSQISAIADSICAGT
jgi:hypothetical protein